MKSENQTSVPSVGKISLSEHDREVVESLEKRFKDEDSGPTM